MQTDTDGAQPAPLPAEADVTPADPSTAAAPAAPEPELEASGEDTADESQADKDKQPVRGGFQRRISELTRAQRELRAKLRELEEENQRLRQPAPQAASDDEPKREQFDTWDEYERAHVRWVARQEIQNATEQARMAEVERVKVEQLRAIQDEWNARLDEARERYDDIDEYVDVVGYEIGPELAVMIQTSERGPDLVRYLGQHPKEMERVKGLSGVKAMRELVKLEAKVQERPKPSAAPNPPNPVKTTTAPTNPLRDDVSTADWIKARNAQLGRK